MTKFLGIGVMSGLLLSVWACTEVNVVIPFSQSRTTDGGHREKPPISQERLKEIQEQKRVEGVREPCPPSRTLPIHPERQETADWCWAATSKTVMAYFNGKGKRTPSQCQIVSHSVDPESGDVDCCPSDRGSTKLECMGGGWPSDAFDKHDFNYEVVREPLDNWEVLKGELCGTGPFVYIIDWRGGGKHALVAAGYSESPGQLVLIYDPTQNDFEYQTYEEFLGNVPDPDGSRSFSHDRNYVQISPKTGGRP